MLRILTTLALFLLIFVTPWWLVMALGVIATFFFESYFELFAIGIIIDSLYNAPTVWLHHFEYIAAALALIILALAEFLKRRLKFYRSA